MTLLAYSVHDEDEGTGGIVFAKSNAQARRIGSQTFGDGDFDWGKAWRLPWADSYAPGPVPFKVMFEHGWWQECWGCGRRIEDGEATEDGDGNPVAFDIVEEKGKVWCTPACRDRDLAEEEQSAAIGAAAIEQLRLWVLERMPGALLSNSKHVYVPRGKAEAQQCVVYFAFPGAVIGEASARYDKAGEEPHVMVCFGDRGAFQAWRARGYPPHLMDGPE